MKVVDIKDKQAKHSPNEMLEKCKDKFSDALIIGWEKDDNGLMCIAASGSLQSADLLWMLENAKMAILTGGGEV
jgi:hypothetical protein